MIRYFSKSTSPLSRLLNNCLWTAIVFTINEDSSMSRLKLSRIMPSAGIRSPERIQHHRGVVSETGTSTVVQLLITLALDEIRDLSASMDILAVFALYTSMATAMNTVTMTDTD